MNVRFYEWPSRPGYFLVLGEGAKGQLGNIDTNMEHIGFFMYSTFWEYAEEQRREITKATSKFVHEQRALKQVIKRLKS